MDVGTLVEKRNREQVERLEKQKAAERQSRSWTAEIARYYQAKERVEYAGAPHDLAGNLRTCFDAARAAEEIGNPPDLIHQHSPTPWARLREYARSWPKGTEFSGHDLATPFNMH